MDRFKNQRIAGSTITGAVVLFLLSGLPLCALMVLGSQGVSADRETTVALLIFGVIVVMLGAALGCFIGIFEIGPYNAVFLGFIPPVVMVSLLGAVVYLHQLNQGKSFEITEVVFVSLSFWGFLFLFGGMVSALASAAFVRKSSAAKKATK